MKRFFSVLMIMTALLLTVPADAQIRFGVKGGVNLSELDWNGGWRGNDKNTTGFFIGPTVEATIPLVGLGVESALMYSQRGENDFKQQGLEVPVNLKYTLGLGSMFGVYFLTGPNFYFNFRNMHDSSKIEDFDTKRTQVAINVGGGIKLLRHLQLGITYQIPLGHALERELEVASAKTKNWQVSLAYMF